MARDLYLNKMIENYHNILVFTNRITFRYFHVVCNITILRVDFGVGRLYIYLGMVQTQASHITHLWFYISKARPQLYNVDNLIWLTS